MRSTYTYVILEISAEAYREIEQKLRDADYGHVFHQEADGTVVIDMHGIALQAEN